MKNVFEEIIKGNIPCDKVFENERILAFRDIAPQAPVHILIIPKKIIKNIEEVSQEDIPLLGEMLFVAKQIAEKEGVSDGFRLITNTGPNSGQEVPHLHFHLMGGRRLGPLG
jgi:histidine triad (HIT) family protein